MSLRIIFSSCLILFSSYFLMSQTPTDEALEELNFLLNIHSYDRSQLEVSQYCGVLDVEAPDQHQTDEFQYDLTTVLIHEPVAESDHFSIDIYCQSDLKCIWVNRRRDVRAKDFLIKNEKAAVRIYELLKTIQGNCN